MCYFSLNFIAFTEEMDHIFVLTFGEGTHRRGAFFKLKTSYI